MWKSDSVFLLTDAQENVGTANGFEAIEGGGVGAVRERICETWHRGPRGEVGTEFWNEKPGGVGAGGFHDNIGTECDG